MPFRIHLFTWLLLICTRILLCHQMAGIRTRSEHSRRFYLECHAMDNKQKTWQTRVVTGLPLIHTTTHRPLVTTAEPTFTCNANYHSLTGSMLDTRPSSHQQQEYLQKLWYTAFHLHVLDICECWSVQMVGQSFSTKALLLFTMHLHYYESWPAE